MSARSSLLAVVLGLTMLGAPAAAAADAPPGNGPATSTDLNVAFDDFRVTNDRPRRHPRSGAVDRGQEG